MQPDSNHGTDRHIVTPPTFHEESEHAAVHDESNWLVSYADLMTLLFGFFVLMYSLSRVDLEKFQVVSKDIAKYFGGRVVDKAVGFKMKESLADIISRAGVTEGVEIASTDSGIVLKFNGSLLFASGSASLKPEMLSTLTEIVRVVQSNRAVNEVKVEGHTDDAPIASNYFPTNWELSAARAARVARQFESAAFPAETLVAEGYGSSRPLKPNRLADGTPILENMAANRRVIINVGFGSEVLAATRALETDKFKTPGEDTPVNGAAGKDGEADQSSVAPVSIEKRLEAAKAELDSKQKKLNELQMAEKKRAQLDAMEKKLQDMENKASEAERKIQALTNPSSASATPADTVPANGVMPLKQGLEQIKKMAPAVKPAVPAKLPPNAKSAKPQASIPAKAPRAVASEKPATVLPKKTVRDTNVPAPAPANGVVVAPKPAPAKAAKPGKTSASTPAANPAAPSPAEAAPAPPQ